MHLLTDNEQRGLLLEALQSIEASLGYQLGGERWPDDRGGFLLELLDTLDEPISGAHFPEDIELLVSNALLQLGELTGEE